MAAMNNDGIEAIVTPWNVQGKIDYTRLVKEFGTEYITEELKIRFEKVTKKPLHPWIKRGIFFSHRGLEKILDAFENGECIFLYTGRGPSNDMHIGHMVPFVFTKWLQDVFDCPLVIQISDEEKFYFKNLDFQDTYELGRENAKDIVAFGFNPKKTFIFSNRDYRMEVPEFENFVSEMKKLISAKQVSKVFGFGECVLDTNGNENYVYKDDVTVGMMDWPFYQTAASFSQAFPHIFNGQPAHCLVPYAIDQDNYFRMGRDLAGKMSLIKPCSIMSTFLDPIKGMGKMSSSSGNEGTIFLTDNAKTIVSKINKHAFSGSKGSGSLEDHKKYGGDVETDIPCRYLRYFEYDDDKYNEICDKFLKGVLTCSDTKKLLAEKIIDIVLEHQKNRERATDDYVANFYKRKPVDFGAERQHTKEVNEHEKCLNEMLNSLNISSNTLYHKDICSDEEAYEVATRVKGCLCKCVLLENKEKEKYLFVTALTNKIDFKKVSVELSLGKVVIVDKERLRKDYNVTTNCLSIFILKKEKLNVIIDSSLRKYEFVNFSPFRTDATMTISYGDMIKFIEAQSCTYNYYDCRRK